MARSGSRASAVTQECVLTPERANCPTCGQRLWIAYHEHRRVVRLDGVWRLTLRVRRCRNQDCAAYHHRTQKRLACVGGARHRVGRRGSGDLPPPAERRRVAPD